MRMSPIVMAIYLTSIFLSTPSQSQDTLTWPQTVREYRAAYPDMDANLLGTKLQACYKVSNKKSAIAECFKKNFTYSERMALVSQQNERARKQFDEEHNDVSNSPISMDSSTTSMNSSTTSMNSSTTQSMTAVEWIISIVFTWVWGLGVPYIYKEKVRRRPLSTAGALLFVVAWVLFNAMLGVAARHAAGFEGSHVGGVWVVIGFLLFYLLRRDVRGKVWPDQGASLTVAPNPKATDDDLFLSATKEFESGTINEALWSRVLAQAEGDREKAKYRYITERVSQHKA